ncbi:MAG: NADH-quinone oxidoreductase subunit N [Desulfocapsaceae bacterium]|nr:NADH-quinone oxidoreductase subunit N [Desulfocapsaceae bacterium]
MNHDFLLLLPVIIVGAGAVLLMLRAAFGKLALDSASVVCMCIFGLAFAAQACSALAGPEVPFKAAFNGMLMVTDFTRVAGLIILGCGFFTAMSSRSYFKENRFGLEEYYSLITFAAFGMLLLTMSHELMTAFISLEIMSLSIYILVGFNRRCVTCAEAVLKYLMLGAFTGGFFAMGTALIYGGLKSTKFEVIASAVATHGFLHTPALVGGAFFIIFAFLFKVAAFPFHAWVVDVYDGSSIPVTGFMATALKTAVFAIFANFLMLDPGLKGAWVTYLFYISILTMFGGNLIAIGQGSIKRMLAASGIVHTGYLLIALVAVSADRFTGSVILYYLAAYSVSTLGIFAALSYLSGAGEVRSQFEDFKGLARTRPYSAAAITIFLLSMAGIPPTAGFMGKFYVITSAIQAGQVTLAVLGIVSSILSMWYYLRLIINMYFHDAHESFESECTVFAPACTLILAVAVFAISLYPITL